MKVDKTVSEPDETPGGCRKCGCGGFEGGSTCLGDDGDGGVCGHRKSDHR
ncbi:MAG: hypothetical protein KIS76_03710 [Pyrinomonadaceae bacterium]|nr:hypothetical protein [Pyrinomonadaceae bacterium]